MYELVQRHWWVMLVTIPLLGYAIFYFIRRRWRDQDSSLPDTRHSFVVSSLLLVALLASLLGEHDQFVRRVETAFLLGFLLVMNGMYFELYKTAKKLSENKSA